MNAKERISELIHTEIGAVSEVAPGQESLAPLATYLITKIQNKLTELESRKHSVNIYDPDWCRENSVIAGELHAGVIVSTYGTTYALPNKDPQKNTEAINNGNLDIYLLEVDGEPVGTACLVDMGDGRAELGRSASIGNAGNSIIQDMRILDWIVNPITSRKYHTLFATLRTAPDRIIDDKDGQFTMRGGQGVTEHWRKFPGLVINGFGPLYLKHGRLEQFGIATLTNLEITQSSSIYVNLEQDLEFINGWHENYCIAFPTLQAKNEMSGANSLKFQAHYPPKESGLTHLVHADIVTSEDDTAVDINEAISQADMAGSPFSQVVLPIDSDTRQIQKKLHELGYQAFGYYPAYTGQSPALIYGKVLNGVGVVPTFWQKEGSTNPLWLSESLRRSGDRIGSKWKIENE